MLVKICSVANIGLETVPVDIEVDVALMGFPGFTIVGLAGKAIEEARERVKTAIINSGFVFPPKKITINLAPADLPKDSVAYDLPMAVGILAASGQLEISNLNLKQMFFYGELSLDGTLRVTRGILLLGLFAQKKSSSTIFVPHVCANEASVVTGIKIIPVQNLTELVNHLQGRKFIQPLKQIKISEDIECLPPDFDLNEIAGQEQAKRALIIAAAGGHNLLMCGPPGTGKTMLARALPGILPPLSSTEALEVTRIYSVAGLICPGEATIRQRPFRAPHHGISAAGMIGGGSHPLPGEVSLAHLGVLFLDEMPEFPRYILESLRQPMEDGQVEVVRVSSHIRYPASFSLVAAINPCPCGWLGHPRKECKCTPKQIARYHRRISGPILDRIDLCVQVAAVEVEKLALTNPKISSKITSKQAKNQVIKARDIQSKRFKNLSFFTNSQMRNKEVKKMCLLTSEAENLLKLAVEKYDFSARSYFRLIKVARTIADLEGNKKITPLHMAEALQYKQIL